jgi:DNA-binding MarR family transcriptional regulator
LRRDLLRGTDMTMREAPMIPPVLDIHAMPGHLLRRLHQAAVALFDNEMRAGGIDLTPVQFAALVMIEAAPGVDQASLAQGIAYDRVTIGGVLDRLEAKGLACRRSDPDDRRVRRVFLAPAGQAVLDAARPVVHRVQDLILGGLEAAERAQLARLMQKALAHVADVSRTPARTRA